MGEEEHAPLTDLGLGTLCLALTLGIISRSWLQKILPIPYTVVLLVMGLVIGTLLVTTFPTSHDIFSNSIHTWVDISPEAVIFCILPILIFEASFSANLFLFYKSLPSVLCMAIPLVVAVGDATADAVIEGLKVEIAKMKVGPGTAPGMDMGPLVTKAHFEKVKGYVDQGVAEGATLVVDGRGVTVPGHEDGYFLGACAEWKVGNSAQVLFKLAGDGAVDGVVTTVVRAWRGFIDDELP